MWGRSRSYWEWKRKSAFPDRTVWAINVSGVVLLLNVVPGRSSPKQTLAGCPWGYWCHCLRSCRILHCQSRSIESMESTEIFTRSCASKQKLWRQSIEWSLLPAQPAKSVFFFANRKKMLSGTYIPISNQSHGCHRELSCVSCMVSNQPSFVSMTHSIHT